MRVVLLALLVVLAGCLKPAAPASNAPEMDGDAALALVAGLISDAQGEARFRVPGTPGHDEAGQWLWEAMQIPSWTVRWQNFTGTDYIGLDKGSAGRDYYEPATFCSADERARLAGLSFHNFWATRGTGDRLVLLGAHWESKRFASQDPDPARQSEPVLGANDGASGVGVLLQLMRHVEANDIALPFQLGVVFFDGEDGFEDCHPLAGSLFFVSQLEPGAVDRFLLLDMVGDSNARFIRETASSRCDPTLVNLLHDRASDVGLQSNFPGTGRPVSDDHIPFLEAGIPAVDLIDFGRTGDLSQSRFGFPPYWHTTGDTLDKLSAPMLGRVGDLVLKVLRDPAFVATWPASC